MLAITDTNVLYGYPKFYDACIAAHIHPIFGMTIYLTDGLYTIETVVLAKIIRTQVIISTFFCYNDEK